MIKEGKNKIQFEVLQQVNGCCLGVEYKSSIPINQEKLYSIYELDDDMAINIILKYFNFINPDTKTQISGLKALYEMAKEFNIEKEELYKSKGFPLRYKEAAIKLFYQVKKNPKKLNKYLKEYYNYDNKINKKWENSLVGNI